MNRRTTIFIVIVAVVFLSVALYFVLWPTQIDLTMNGAEVDLEGNVIGSGEMVIEGWAYNYLFQYDCIKLEHLRLPNRAVGKVYGSESVLLEVDPVPGHYMTYIKIELPEYTSQKDYIADLFFSEDHSLWIIKMNGRIFVGTTGTNADYADIMDTWGDLIDGVLDK